MRITHRFGVALLGASVAAGCAAQRGMHQVGAPQPSTAGSAAVMPAPGGGGTAAATAPATGALAATTGVISGAASAVSGGASKMVSWCTPSTKVDAAPDPTSLSSKMGKPTPDLHIAMAEMQERSGNFKQAREHYEAALKQSPKNLEAQLGVAHLLDREGKLKEATDKYQLAAKQHPREARVWNDLGLCYARQKKMDDSARALGKAVELEPQKPLFRNNMATVLIEMGRNDDALAQLQATNNPAVAHYNLGYLLYQKGNKALAADHFAKSASADPSFAPARDWVSKLASEGAPPTQAQVAANADALRQSYVAEQQGSGNGGYEPYYRNQLRRDAAEARVTGASYAGSAYPATTSPAGTVPDFTRDRIATAPRALPPVDSSEGPPTQR